MLLLDEPYGALDGFTRAKMQFFLLDIFQKRELAALNPTVVLAFETGDEFMADKWHSGRIVISELPLCEFLAFEALSGDLKSNVSLRGDGSVEEITSELFAEQFVLFGELERCRCIEYRQLVRAGPAVVHLPDGDPLRIEVPTTWVEVSGTWTKQYGHSADKWVEDTRAVEPLPTIWRYGHRGDVREIPPDEFSTDEYSDDFTYTGIDRGRLFLPNGLEIPPGTRITINAEFKGQIVGLTQKKRGF